MAIAMIGGLALGTLVTLGLIPLLYEVLFGIKRWAVEPECRHRAWRSLMSLLRGRVLRILRIRMHPRFMRMSR